MTSRKPKPKDGKTAMDALVAEVDRLREENSILKERAGTIEAQGVAGRLPISDLRDRDWPELIKAVERIPFIYQSTGHLGALAYCQQTVASSLHALSLKAPRTADLVQSQHVLNMFLEEGQAELMMREDYAGKRSRAEFLHQVELHVLRPAYRAAFEKSLEAPRMPPEEPR